MHSVRIHIESNQNFTEEVRSVFQLLQHNHKVNLEFVSSAENAHVTAGVAASSDFVVNGKFFGDIRAGEFRHDKYFQNDCVIRDAVGKPDYLATAFYMVNSLQEYNATEVDEIGRFPYKNSYQKKFSNIQENLVQQCFESILKHPKFGSSARHTGPSRIFLSHDIDSVNGAVLQDSLFLLKKGNPFPIVKLVFNAMASRPDWLNMDKIMNIEDEHSLKSTFFWLVNSGRINKREINADYNIKSKPIRNVIQDVKARGWENGLHKSISQDSYKVELEKLAVDTAYNRNHYLKYRLPQLYDDIAASGLSLDASLGFAEAYGFRNNYGLPFHPFNLKDRRPYPFVEVPLNVMDGTFKQYTGVPLDQTADKICSFLDKHATNCLISVLWHNTYFTDFKFAGYMKVYRTVLQHIHERGLAGINPGDIIKEYKWAA